MPMRKANNTVVLLKRRIQRLSTTVMGSNDSRRTQLRYCHGTTRMSFCLLLSLLYVTNAFPTLLVDSGKPKCVTVEGPRDTVIRVQYEAPGT